MNPISLRQHEMLKAIRRNQLRYGWTPSVRELAVELGMNSPSTVLQHLKALERKGYLRRPQADGCKGRKARVLIVTEAGLDVLEQIERLSW